MGYAIVHRAVIGLALTGVIEITPVDLGANQDRMRVRVLEAGRETPVAGATAEVVTLGGVTVVSATSDAAGLAEFDRPSGGIMTVKAAGFAPTKLRLSAAVAGVVTIRLSRSSSLRVIVTDAAGGTLIRARAALVLHRAGNPSSYGLQTEAGVMDFRDLPPASGRLLISSDGFAPSARPVVLQESSPATELFELRRPGVIVGRVVDSAGLPVAGATLSIAYSPTLFDGPALARLAGGRLRTNRDGEFYVDGIIPNQQFVLLTAAGSRRAQPIRLTVSEGQRSEYLVVRIE